MAEILFAAHDPGGANMLRAVMADTRSAGHGCAGFPAGPAIDIWRDEPSLRIIEDGSLSDLEFSFLVTGTSMHSLHEQEAWRIAASKSIRSMALIDSWTNFRSRFSDPSGRVTLPDSICVIDSACRQRLRSADWWRGDVFVIGQPHVEASARRIREQRDRFIPPPGPPTVTFFSERLREDFPGDESILFDQYQVADMVLRGVRDIAPVTLIVKPHPREDNDPWTAWLKRQTLPPGVSLSIGGEASRKYLIESSIILGMTSMVLFEAALAGAPVIAFRFQEKSLMSDKLAALSAVRVVRSADALRAALAGRRERTVVDQDPFRDDERRGFPTVLENALSRLQGERRRAG